MSRTLFCRGLVFVSFLLIFPAPGHARATSAALKASIEQRALLYFLESAHPKTGLVKDGAPNFAYSQRAPASIDRMSSMAATGFGLAVEANAASRGLMKRDLAYGNVLKTLRFARDHVPRWHGWFVHFADWETGERFGGSEFSTIDTALFMGGALYAAAIFPHTEAAEIAYALYRDMDFFDMLTDGGTQPQKETLSMGYLPESGYIPAEWNMPAEQMLLVLLGLGHPTHPLPARAWLAWPRTALRFPDGRSIIGANMPLFVHQYSQLFVDFRAFRDRFANYFENGADGTAFNRSVSRSDTHYATYRAGFWGISAGITPAGYRAHGPLAYDSTVCIGCALGSAMYDPERVLADAADWLTLPCASKIWGRYGFVDSIDLDQSWFADRVLAITVGPIFLSLANTDDATSIWQAFQTLPEIQNALRKAAQAR